ncbi:LysR family transcriptional regulator [Vibrio kasasachensis]|uniref:LysR family transcriptional regulator n=1 Tax=Vibrio kasasachensis TaxID=2910248 RepID=UPI003D0CAD82
MDRLKSIEVFVEVVDVGSFTKAADKFGITPAMVGKHIKHLEHSAGAPLLNRNTRKQSLTELGDAFLLRCHKILNEYTALEKEASLISNAPKGTLSINAPITFGSLILSPIVCDFLDLYPNIDINLELTDKLIDVAHDGYDVIFRIGELTDASYVGQRVTNYELVFCASPQYLNAYGIPKNISELTKHRCLGFSYWKKQSKILSTLETNAFDIAHSRFRSNNGMALKIAALNDWGVLLQPRLLIEEELRAGKLVEILYDYKPSTSPVNILYKSRNDISLKIRLFIDFVIKTLRSNEQQRY